jgi:hypothetical protein
LILPGAVVNPSLQVYSLVSILLLTAAAIVHGANNFSAIADWGYRNEKCLRRFGFPKGQFPTHSTLQKIYTKIDIDSFENVLAAWLREHFPLVPYESIETELPINTKYAPGLRPLWPYRRIASEVVAKLY